MIFPTQVYRYTLLSLFLLLTITSKAQQISGLDLSNYGGLYRVTYNPSTLGATPYKFQVNGLTLGGSIGRRYFDFFGKNSFLTPILASQSTDEIYGRSRTMKSLTDQRINLQSEIRWPSVLFSVGKIHGFALQARTRGFIYGYAPSTIKTLYAQRMDNDLPINPSPISNPHIELNQLSFSDISFSYGISIINKKAHKLKLGITGKSITGARLSSIQMTADNIAVNTTTPDAKSLDFTNVSYSAFYTNEMIEQKLPPVFNTSKYGSGWAYDWGISYELGNNIWKNNKESFDTSPTYFLRLGASMTDIGNIKYKPSNISYKSGEVPQLTIGQTEMEQIANYGAKGFMNLMPPTSYDTLLMKTASLPTVLHLEADLQLAKSFFINVSNSQGLVSSKPDAPQGNIDYPDYTRITPRFEGQDFDLAIPITLIENQKAQVGLTAHFGPLFVSFSNITGIFEPKEKKGATMAYIGLSVFKLKK